MLEKTIEDCGNNHNNPNIDHSHGRCMDLAILRGEGYMRVAWAEEIKEASQKQKEITVYITKTGSKYHRTGCRFLSKSKITISFEEAVKKGYMPCSVCKPPKLMEE